MKRSFVYTILTLAAATSGIAKPKENIYPASCDRVWAAVKRATAPPHYNFAQLDDAQMKGMISTGNFATGKRVLDITLSGTGNSCTIAIGGIFSGLVHNDKGDLFDRIKRALVEPTESLPVQLDTPMAASSMVSKALSGTSLTNADILKLKAAGLSDELISEKIKISPANFRLETSDIVELKQAGLSNEIVGAMIQASQR
jgi:hypothetical protein